MLGFNPQAKMRKGMPNKMYFPDSTRKEFLRKTGYFQEVFGCTQQHFTIVLTSFPARFVKSNDWHHISPLLPVKWVTE
jgi:hypothetical protein